MTEAEELELLELEEEEAGHAHAAPAALAKAPDVGAGETFLNKTAAALPLGKQLVNALSAIGMQHLKYVEGVGEPGARLTPQAKAEMAALGMAVPEEKSAIPGVVDSYRNARGDFDTRTAAGAEAHPYAAGAGTVAGTALSLAAPLPKVSIGGAAAGPGARILSNALTAAGYGAVNGAANSRGDLLKGELGQVLSDAVGVEGLQRAGQDFSAGNYGRGALDVMGAGGVGGGITGGLLSSGVEGVRASGLLPKAAALVKGIANKQSFKALGGMKPEINQLGEEAAKQIGANALESGVVTPLASRQTMLERALAARKAAGLKLSDSLGELDAAASPAQRVDPFEAARRVEDLARDTASKPALRTTANKFANEAQAIRDAAPRAPGGMSLQEFEANVARPYKQTTNWNTDLALPKETLKRLPRALEAEVERVGGDIAKSTGNRTALEGYLSGKKDYGKFADIADLAQTGVDRNTAKKAAGLYDVMAMVGAGAASHSPTEALLKAGGGLLASKLASRFGNQMSATGANTLAKLLSGAQGAALSPVGLAASLGNTSRQQLPPGLAPLLEQLALGDDKHKAMAEALARSAK